MEEPHRISASRAPTVLAAALLILAGCSHTLAPSNVSAPASGMTMASHGAPARYFIDTVHVRKLEERRIGQKNNAAGAFFAWVYTDADLSTWAANEWKTYLNGRGQFVTSTLRDADYYIQCDVHYLWVVKDFEWFEPDGFTGTARISATIYDRASKTPLFRRQANATYFVQREGETEDGEMFNVVMSGAFRKALAKLGMPSLPAGKK
ncbi:hypothetical protein GX586_09225 [bacterium]|nr:hypothetical protein [bacterium]